ncbi:MAG: ABC transporter substrate-binding protein, partial [Planctomycetaceae bacterium]|nr:ABC transporter substrate-binding protein [Planctomycetaceae bacterium]
SLGLTQRLLVERDHPRCDVFWNNQVLGTAQLAEEGILLPYKGSGYSRIPKVFKHPDGLWTGFAGRLRVWIVNTDKLAPDEDSLKRKLESDDLARFAIAEPLYGTTLSHFGILWQDWGPESLKDWHADIQRRNARIVQGNATVKNLVAEGVCDFGWTDTDDFFVALDDGFPVQMAPLRVNGKTICLPNSVAIIRGTKRLTDSQRLVDFLLSEKTELALAASAARQIPLGLVDQKQLSEDVRQMTEWAQESVRITDYSHSRNECLEWLKSVSTP